MTSCIVPPSWGTGCRCMIVSVFNSFKLHKGPHNGGKKEKCDCQRRTWQGMLQYKVFYFQPSYIWISVILITAWSAGHHLKCFVLVPEWYLHFSTENETMLSKHLAFQRINLFLQRPFVSKNRPHSSQMTNVSTSSPTRHTRPQENRQYYELNILFTSSTLAFTIAATDTLVRSDITNPLFIQLNQTILF